MQEKNTTNQDQQQSSNQEVFYGLIAIGPSGSGKSTFCYGVQQYFQSIKRKHVVINLDPANETMKYKCQIDIRDLIQLDEVMEEFKLGPNGALIYCINCLEENIDWLYQEILKYKDHYLIIDFPGQIELYLNSQSLKNVLEKVKVNEQFQTELTAVELFDSLYCYDSYHFISVCLQAITTMVNLELPHVNVLSKIDLMKQYGKTPYGLDFYLDSDSLNYIFQFDDDEEEAAEEQDKRNEQNKNEEQKKNNSKHNKVDRFNQKYKNLNKSLAELVDDQRLLNFQPLRIEDVDLLSNLIRIIDKANGYTYSVKKQKEEFNLRQNVAENNDIQESERRMILEEELFGDEWQKEENEDN